MLQQSHTFLNKDYIITFSHEIQQKRFRKSERDDRDFYELRGLTTHRPASIQWYIARDFNSAHHLPSITE